MVANSAAKGGPEFRTLLRRFRDRKNWSQERTAAESEMDHSLVSRLESGQRSPTREAIGKLARGLKLEDWERDRLLIAAGFLPHDTTSLVADEEEIVTVLRILRNPSIPESKKQGIRQAVGALASAIV